MQWHKELDQLVVRVSTGGDDWWQRPFVDSHLNTYRVDARLENEGREWQWQIPYSADCEQSLWLLEKWLRDQTDQRRISF